MVFTFDDAPTPVRADIVDVCISTWRHISEPGPILDGSQRVTVLAAARAHEPPVSATGIRGALLNLAHVLYHRPSEVSHRLVRSAAEVAGDPAAVEVVSLTAMLAAIDGLHRGLGIDPAPLPTPQPGPPTGDVTPNVRHRRGHVPMPPGSIPHALDLLPGVGAYFRSMFGALYMTLDEMASPTFARRPGLDRAQMELVATRTSLVNECFY